jgi:hypothetical protein
MFKKSPFIFFILIMFACQTHRETSYYGVFNFEQQLSIPGSPDIVYDSMTGDISGWWDHSFSEKPYRIYIEAKPGGGFYEIFNEKGDGALHATVILAERGKILRFDGPLGLSGKAIQLVCTYEFSPLDSDSTLLKLSVHGSGEIQKGLPALVEKVWHHFLFERFKPYMVNKIATEALHKQGSGF